MSRIGKKPIQIPEGVTLNIAEKNISVKGAKGELYWRIPSQIRLNLKDNILKVEKSGDSKNDRAMYGLSRSLINNMVIGVSEGFNKELELIGIGYRAQLKGNTIEFALGFSNNIEFTLPEGITADIDKKQTKLILKGIDKQLLGQVAANIKSLRPPDSYKGKGIRYVGERIKLKPGKTGVK